MIGGGRLEWEVGRRLFVLEMFEELGFSDGKGEWG